MAKATPPDNFGLPHQLKGHRDPQQGREGEQNGSAQRQGLLDRYVVGSHPKTVRALPASVQIKLQIGNTGAGALDWSVQLAKTCSDYFREKADLGGQ
jgi:hypothetical protein